MATEAQAELLGALRERDAGVRVTWNPDTSVVTHLSGTLTVQLDNVEDPAALARDFLATHGALLGLEDPAAQLGEPIEKTDAFGWHHLTFPQTVDDVPVWGSAVRVHVSTTGTIRSISSDIRPDARVDTQPTVAAGSAVAEAGRQSGVDAQPQPAREPRLTVYVHEGRPHLAWEFTLPGWDQDPGGAARQPAAWRYFVDAHNGTVIARFNQEMTHVVTTGTGTAVSGAAKTFPVSHTHGPDTYRLQDSGRGIDVYDVAGATTAPSGNLSEDPDNVWDDTTGLTSTNHAQRIQCQCAEVDAIDHFARTYDYYTATFGRSSLDNAGMTISAYTHLRTTDSGSTIAWNNASWNGTQQIFKFGDGQYDGIDGDWGDKTFYTAALDVVAHEYTHGVAQFEVLDVFGAPSNFDYSGESGATAEAFSDIFGAFVDGDWRHGDSIVVLGPGETLWSAGKKWRDLSNPTRGLAYDPNDTRAQRNAKGGPQPDHYDDRYQGADDYGGVHINSSVLTYAWYLATHGGVSHRPGRTPTDVRVYRQDRQGIGQAHAEQILYHALSTRFNGNTNPTFAEVREAVLDVCDQMAVDHQHGIDECDWKTLNSAFYAVGLQPAGDPYGPDPMITPWGDRTGTGPRYQTPDIWVEAPGGAHVNAEKGIVNTLVAQVHNIGDEPANDVTIRYYYAPYGHGYPHTDFKQIDEQTVNLAAGESRAVAGTWDLTDLTEDFGGVWPRPIDDFDHFCVRVRIFTENDVNTCNNMAQHNFVDVTIHPGASYETLMIIANPDPERNIEMLLRLHASVPRSWTVLLDDARVPEKLPLQGNEKRVAKLSVQTPRTRHIEAPLDGTVAALIGERARYPLRARLEDSTFDTESSRFKGTLTMEGRTRLVAAISGHIVDLDTGDFEGTLSGTALRYGKPVALRDKIRGRLTPERRVSLGGSVNGTDVGGVDLNLVLEARTPPPVP